MKPHVELKYRLRQLGFGLLGLKQFWAILSTVLLWFGKVPAEIWAAVVMFVLGARTYEKTKDVSYKAPRGD